MFVSTSIVLGRIFMIYLREDSSYPAVWQQLVRHLASSEGAATGRCAAVEPWIAGSYGTRATLGTGGVPMGPLSSIRPGKRNG